MKIGQKISLEGIKEFGLGPLEVDLGESSVNRDIKVWMVPKTICEDRYFISITEPGVPEELPPCKIKDASLLLHYKLDPEGNTDIVFIRKEVRNA